MQHFPNPYFRKNRQNWTVQINGHQHNLGRDRNRGRRSGRRTESLLLGMC